MLSSACLFALTCWHATTVVCSHFSAPIATFRLRASPPAVSLSHSCLLFPPRATVTPSYYTKNGTVASDAPPSRTLHWFRRTLSEIARTAVKGPWTASLIVSDLLSGNTALEQLTLLRSRLPPPRNARAHFDPYRPRSSHVIQTPPRRCIYRRRGKSDVVSIFSTATFCSGNVLQNREL